MSNLTDYLEKQNANKQPTDTGNQQRHTEIQKIRIHCGFERLLIALAWLVLIFGILYSLVYSFLSFGILIPFIPLIFGGFIVIWALLIVIARISITLKKIEAKSDLRIS